MGRKPKGSGEKSSSNGVWGKSVSKEKSIYATLKEITGTDMKAYYIMFLYCPEYLKEVISVFQRQLQKIYVKGILWNRDARLPLSGC